MALGPPGGYGRAMKRWERLARLGTQIADVAIPGTLALLALNDIWGAPLTSPLFHGPRGVQTAGALLMTVALGWRRRYPVAVLACVTIGAVIEWQWNRIAGQVSLEAWLSILVAYYSVGAHVGTRRGVRVIAVGMLPLLTADVANAIGGHHSATAISSGGGVYAALVLTWAVGNAFRRRGVRELELESRAERLEREREQSTRIAAAEERA